MITMANQVDHWRQWNVAKQITGRQRPGATVAQHELFNTTGEEKGNKFGQVQLKIDQHWTVHYAN